MENWGLSCLFNTHFYYLDIHIIKFVIISQFLDRLGTQMVDHVGTTICFPSVWPAGTTSNNTENV